MHVGSLDFGFLGQELIDLLRRISRGNELIPQSLGIPLSLVSLEDDVTFRVDDVSESNSINIMSPLVEEVLDSVLSDMFETSLKEPLFEIFVLTSILEGVQSTLDPSF